MTASRRLVIVDTTKDNESYKACSVGTMRDAKDGRKRETEAKTERK